MNRICLSLSSTLDWETIKRQALKAEESGYHSVWFGDHIMSSPFFGPVSRFECWTLISALAPHLETLRVGPLVLAESSGQVLLKCGVRAFLFLLVSLF